MTDHDKMSAQTIDFSLANAALVRQDTPAVRQEIAGLAARLIAEEGIQDFAAAKRKAVRLLGVSAREPLPDNAEIEAELRTYRRIFRDEEDDLRLQLMREAAVDILRDLATFRPYLTGSVLDGTAGAFSEIDIDVFPDSAKELEIFLLDQRVEYEHREVRRRDVDSPEMVLLLEWGEIPVALRVYDPVQERVRRRSHSGRKHERASLSQAEQWLASGDWPEFLGE